MFLDKLKNDNELLQQSKDFLENFSLDFAALENKLNKIKDVILNIFDIHENISISFDESTLFGRSGSVSDNNISFNKTRICMLETLKIDDLDENNLTAIEIFYNNSPLKTNPTQFETIFYDFIKRYKEMGAEKYFSVVGSYKTVKYELLTTIFHECQHVLQKKYNEYLTKKSFSTNIENLILLFTALFNKMFKEASNENLHFEYDRDNLTYPIEFDARFVSFDIMKKLKNTYYKDDKIFNEFLKKTNVFPENFSSRKAACQVFNDYERLYNLYETVFGNKYCDLNNLIHDYKSKIIAEMTKRYDKMNKKSTPLSHFHF